jgi:hypothetical protein
LAEEQTEAIGGLLQGNRRSRKPRWEHRDHRLVEAGARLGGASSNE